MGFTYSQYALINLLHFITHNILYIGNMQFAISSDSLVVGNKDVGRHGSFDLIAYGVSAGQPRSVKC